MLLPLKEAAAGLDAALAAARTLTLVHGDAKPANFCFGLRPGDPVAGVDFQYVGRGSAMQDVAYFVGSCMDGPRAARLEGHILDTYFEALRACLPASIDAGALEREWRSLYPVAWADFERFLAVHFTKVGDQTLLALDTWIDSGRAQGQPTADLVRLRDALRAARGLQPAS